MKKWEKPPQFKVKSAIYKVLEESAARLAAQIEEANSPFVKHTLDVIRRAQAIPEFGPVMPEVVSVQPYPRPLGGVAFYRPRYGTGKGVTDQEPAGSKLRFKAKSIEALTRLRGHADFQDGVWGDARSLTGYALGGTRCVELYNESFSIVNGLGLVQDGDLCEIDGLANNESHREFLLRLYWGSETGWPSEMHVVAIQADEGIEGVFDGDGAILKQLPGADQCS